MDEPRNPGSTKCRILLQLCVFQYYYIAISALTLYIMPPKTVADNPLSEKLSTFNEKSQNLFVLCKILRKAGKWSFKLTLNLFSNVV